MKKGLSLILSALLLSSTVACQKPASKTQNSSSSVNTASSVQTTKDNTKPTISSSQTTQATVSAGTEFDTSLEQEVSTGKNKNQDKFTLKVKTGLIGGNATLKEAKIHGHLEDVIKATKGKKAKLNLVFDEIVLKNGDTYPVDVTLVNTKLETKTKGKFLQNVGIVLAGATAGHFLGNKAKFKHGGLAGGAAAAAYVLSSPGGEVVLKKGTIVKLKLRTPLKPT
jgi:hypothetical protein